MAIKLPSVNHLIQQVTGTVKRFPFACMYALIGSWSAVELTSGYIYTYINEEWLTRILMMAAVGMPLSLSVSLFTLSRHMQLKSQRVLNSLFATLPVILLWVYKPQQYPQHIVHFALLCLAMHLLVSFAAFAGTRSTPAFWQFNKNLFTRLITGLVYSVVLGAGLSAAFATVDSIFGINLNWNYLRYTWIVIIGLFNTLFFLAGIPQNFDNPDAYYTTGYPKNLKFFSQYILVPLASVYLAILLAYELKILVQWQLPKGLVSALILGYAGIGILALLLVYPIREQEGNSWIKVFSRYFYLFLLPLIFLLILAVTRRVSSYGITQYRYFLIASAAWLLFLTLYFLLYKKATIKAIPVSLFTVVLLIIYGPLSATSVSLHSQQRVLLNLFKQQHSLRQNKLLPVKEEKLEAYPAVRMASTLNYILNHYHFSALQPLISINLSNREKMLRHEWDKGNYSIPDERGFKYYRNSWMQHYLGLGGYEYRQNYSEEQLETQLYANYYIRSKTPVAVIKGYDYMLEKEAYPDTSVTDTLNGFIVRQRENATYDSLLLRIGKTEFAFSASQLAAQLTKQTKILKAYADQTTEQGLDKRYLLPAGMLRLTQKKQELK